MSLYFTFITLYFFWLIIFTYFYFIQIDYLQNLECFHQNQSLPLNCFFIFLKKSLFQSIFFKLFIVIAFSKFIFTTIFLIFISQLFLKIKKLRILIILLIQFYAFTFLFTESSHWNHMMSLQLIIKKILFKILLFLSRLKFAYLCFFDG